MNSYNYDLHIHSCLSPCGDDDMTPANIAGMAALKGLNVVALTDHNTSKNCPAFFAQAKKHGLIPVPGMELTTSEDIHVICIFPTLELAMDFDGYVGQRRVRVRNRSEIFGNQFIMNESDEICGEEPDLLINGTTIDLETAYSEVTSRGGACYPAHVDRESNGMIAVLGDLPDSPVYQAFELNDKNSLGTYLERYPRLRGKRYIVSSDAHYLRNISEAGQTLTLDDEPYSSQKVRESLIGYLRGE